jgi:hypothetical protein
MNGEELVIVGLQDDAISTRHQMCNYGDDEGGGCLWVCDSYDGDGFSTDDPTEWIESPDPWATGDGIGYCNAQVR